MVAKNHICRYCGHKGTAQGKDSDLCRDGKNFGDTYSCKDVNACGERIRAMAGEPPHDGLPF